MKKEYVKCEMEITYLEETDIITNSACDFLGTDGTCLENEGDNY